VCGRRDPEVLDGANPVCIPRDHAVRKALVAAAVGDLNPPERLREVLPSPYEERPGLGRYATPAPEDLGPCRTFCGT
jgi:serine/tyrosine/threonine adenylyltransferase